MHFSYDYLAIGYRCFGNGPIGQGWSVPSQTSSALLVAGGVGGAPLYLQAEALLAQNIEVDVILGAQPHRRWLLKSAIGT